MTEDEDSERLRETESLLGSRPTSPTPLPPLASLPLSGEVTAATTIEMGDDQLISDDRMMSTDSRTMTATNHGYEDI